MSLFPTFQSEQISTKYAGTTHRSHGDHFKQLALIFSHPFHCIQWHEIFRDAFLGPASAQARPVVKMRGVDTVSADQTATVVTASPIAATASSVTRAPATTPGPVGCWPKVRSLTQFIRFFPRIHSISTNLYGSL